MARRSSNPRAGQAGHRRQLENGHTLWERTMTARLTGTAMACILFCAVSRSSSPAPGSAATADQLQTTLVSRGEYLARVGDCVACHTKHDGVPFTGGFAMPTPFGTLYSPNITPDGATGTGKWNATEFYQMLHTGRSRDGT